MNLDLLPLGWVHAIACLVALATGAAGFGTRKGSPAHILNGRLYLGSMVVLNVSALGIYRLDIFFFPHMLAVLTLVIIAVGWASARFHWPRTGWKHLHLSSMIASYYLLLGGGVNEAFLRVHALREILNDQGPPLLGQTHAALMLLFLILLLGWNAVEIVRAMRRRRLAPA
jgi:uncharacterized membrane protein